MRQIVVLVEGQTEEQFVRTVLQPYLNPYEDAVGLWVTPMVVATSRTGAGLKARGGGSKWRNYDRDLRLLLAQPHWYRVGLLLDYYAYPRDGPGATIVGVAKDRHAGVLSALCAQYPDPRFAPCLALHEFETWVIAAASSRTASLGQAAPAAALHQVVDAFHGDVEAVNDGPDTSPSKRLAAAWAGYVKTIDGVAVVQEAGLDSIRAHCPALDVWLSRLI
jgi:Domain of unknown function (DUF4276)